MISRIFGFGFLLLALALIGTVAVGRHPEGKVGQTATTDLCLHVGEFTQTITAVRAGTLTSEQTLARLGQAQMTFALDAQREQNHQVAPHIANLATDISDWRTALLSADVVSQDIAINRTLSELLSLPSC
jgi:hypothetical protein